jgi:pantoate--beta-alanine ligase
MKLIKHISDLNKAINKEINLGFVPTMGNLHKGHESLIKKCKKKCNKTLVSIFINPTQFNNKRDFNSYPRTHSKDLKVLKKLRVDYVFLPTEKDIYKEQIIPKIILKKSQNILCAKFRAGHFESVLDVLNRFVRLISPKIIFMGEKDYQQFFLVKKFIEKKYESKVLLCNTVRDSNKVALSSRNSLLNKSSLKKAGLIANELFNLKLLINKDKMKSKNLIKTKKNKLIKDFKIKIEYLECRNLIDLSLNLKKKPFKLFVAYYLNKVRLIDNF